MVLELIKRQTENQQIVVNALTFNIKNILLSSSNSRNFAEFMELYISLKYLHCIPQFNSTVSHVGYCYDKDGLGGIEQNKGF